MITGSKFVTGLIYKYRILPTAALLDLRSSAQPNDSEAKYYGACYRIDFKHDEITSTQNIAHRLHYRHT
jgi:hypothetical protein